MTTTSTMCGLGAEEKPTSRVLRPPGGGSSDIFGTACPNPTPPRQQTNYRGSSNIFGAGEETASPQGQAANKQSTHSNIFGAEEHKIYGKGRNQSQFNPITGEPYEEDGSPASATPGAAKTPQNASPSVGASAQTGQGDGSLQAAPGKAQSEVHTSSRVLNPPGGRTHKLW